jgi:hypothetical protein
VWFDQGHTLLHNFWYYEAERAFRWCLKLDPECAMAYLGLARVTTFGKPSATSGNERSAAFIKEAVKRKDKVTERERLYIEAREELWKDEPGVQIKPQDSSKSKAAKLQQLGGSDSSQLRYVLWPERHQGPMLLLLPISS